MNSPFIRSKLSKQNVCTFISFFRLYKPLKFTSYEDSSQSRTRKLSEFIVFFYTLCNLLSIAFFNKIVYKKTIFLSCEIILQVLDFCQFGKDADNERYNDNIALQML